MVTLYTRNFCSACKNVKALLNTKGVDYTEVNIEDDYDAAMKLVGKGFRTVPVLDRDGTFRNGAAIYDVVRSL